MTLKVDVDLSGVFAELDDCVDAVGQSLKKAVYLGAVIVRNEAIALAPISAKAHIFRSGKLDKETGKFRWNGQEYLFYPGDLRRSIYVVYDKDSSIDLTKAVYKVSWRTKNNQGAGLLSVPYAWWVEFGNATHAAHPFVRKAYDIKHQTAEQTIIDTIKDALNAQKHH